MKNIIIKILKKLPISYKDFNVFFFRLYNYLIIRTCNHVYTKRDDGSESNIML